ncbi:MAG TPA: glutamyl-tRNA reductase [Verrucomicrobiae bacterium]|nr:glutamyl-tRNA reductase [Verrucomicrobiae bacterium]
MRSNQPDERRKGYALAIMEIALIGVSHRTASIELRERLAFRVDQACEAADQLRARGVLKETLVLSTCNRTEIYGVTRDRAAETLCAMELFLGSYHQISPEEMRSSLYRHGDREAVRHLYRVAAGLDSMLLGESEILGQVREAYRVAMDHGSTGRVLNRLFQSALEVGKRIRTETQIATRPMSVAFAGVKLAESLLRNLENQRVLIIGAGATSEQVVKHLCDRGVPQFRVLNRTLANAKALVTRYGGEVLPWEKLPESMDWPDLIVTSVLAPEPILTCPIVEAAMAARQSRPLIIMDLGVPRNVAADVKNIPGVHLSDIDGLTEIVEHNKKAREEEIPRAVGLVEEQIDAFMRWQAGVAACSAFAEIRAVAEHKREALLNRHLDAMSHLTEMERQHFKSLIEKFLGDSRNGSSQYSCAQSAARRKAS